MNEFSVYLTFDIDQDFNPGTNDYYNRSNASFRSFDEGFSLLINKIHNHPFSVFIRADYQIKYIYGSYDYLLKNNPTVIQKIYDSNGEINWHIHLYKLTGDKWGQIEDTKDQVQSLLNDYLEVKQIKALNHKIIRIGECVMSNELMRALDNVGVLIDSTALPGRKRSDKEKRFDWELTTNKFFNPSKLDYRIPGVDNYKILEIPMSTINMRADYDRFPVKRYFNLSFKTDILFQNFDEYVKNNNDLITITHPFEVLNAGSHGLVSYDIKTFEKNITLLKEKVRANGKKLVFRKISDITKGK